MRHGALLGALTAALGFPAGASASITPGLAAAPSSTTAGATVSLSTDVTFAPTTADSPRDMTLSLPAGLLSNAATDGGACLKTTIPLAACRVGSGTITATLSGSSTPITVPDSLYLVAPAKSADIAGLYVQTTALPGDPELGAPGEVSLRPSGSSRGIGVDVAFTAIPDQIDGIALSVSQIKTTLTGVRMPTSCPATPATFVVRADSYADPTTRTASVPFAVTACDSLPFTPHLSLAAARDRTDAGVSVATTITQPGTPAQASARAAVLTLPPALFAPHVDAVLDGAILCPNLTSCRPIGAVRASSPLDPTPLTGSAFLIGSLTDPSRIRLVLAFAPPYALNLTGAVNVNQGTATFTGLPDLPLGRLTVRLFGGRNAAFTATCRPASGSAASRLTTQNGDRTVTTAAPVRVSGCRPGHGPAPGRPRAGAATLSGLSHGHPVLRFTLIAGAHAPKLSAVTIVLPTGLRARGTVVSVRGAHVRSVSVARGRVVVSLRAPAARVTVTVRGLAVSAGLVPGVKRRAVAIIPRDAHGRSTLLSAPLVPGA